MVNQTAFVLTNARLIMLRTNGKGKPQHTFWMIYYSEIETFVGGWTGSMKLKLEDGRKMNFSGFPKPDRKAMVEVFEAALKEYQEKGFEPSTTQSMENLCSHCYDVVPKDEFKCEGCGATFWKPSELAFRSLIFPSWGDFLMGHYWLAIFEMLGYLVGLVVFVVSTGMALKTGRQEEIVGAIISLVLFFFFAHAVDAGVTYSVAKKGLNPKTGPLRPVE